MYELKIAMRQVFSRRRQTFFAVLAVTLAIAVITVMMAMLSGFQTELIQSTIENNPHIIINPEHEGDFIHLYTYISTRIAEKEGVVAVSPKYLGQAALKYRDKAEGVSLQGVEPEAEDLVLRVNKDVVNGDFFALAHTRYGIVLRGQACRKPWGSTWRPC